MSNYLLNNSSNTEKELGITSMHQKHEKAKTKPLHSVYQSRTTEDTGTFK